MNPLEMENIVAWGVVSAVRRANPSQAGCFRQLEHRLVQVGGQTEGKGEVTNWLVDDRLQFLVGRDHFVMQLIGVADLAQVGMSARVSANLDSSQ